MNQMGREKFLVCSLLIISLSPLVVLCSTSNEYFKHECGQESVSSAEASTYYATLYRLLLGRPQIDGKAIKPNYDGDPPNVAHVLFLCSGYLPPYVTDCNSCIATATSEIVKRCPERKNAIMWSAECLVRYSDRNFSSLLNESSHEYPTYIQDMILSDTWATNITNHISEVISQPYRTKFWSFLMYGSDSIYNTKYNYSCFQDFDPIDCAYCLNFAFYLMYDKTHYPASANISLPGCRIYQDSLGVRASPNPPRGQETPPPQRSDNTNDNGSKTTLWITVVSLVGGGCFLLALAICLIYVRRKKKLMEEGHMQDAQVYDVERALISEELPNEYFHGERPLNSQELPLMRLEVICEATDNFSVKNKLGQGGFGPVYKGTLPDGKLIAVKRLLSNSSQGIMELKTEVALIARLQHRNLVRLLGCCLENDEKLLIYEYMPNKGLDFHLFGSNGVCLDWQRRLNIIDGISRGLLYLHEDSRLRIIHRDLKASNILLDTDMSPKISDFGTAWILCGNQMSHTTTRVVGTYGYMAPEYAMEGIFSVKSDVFSFGVLLLEILSGKRNTEFHLHMNGQSLLNHAWMLWGEDRGLELIDPRIGQLTLDVAQALKCIHIGLLCVQEEPANRPNMSVVVLMLRGDSCLPQPTRPAFSVGRYAASSSESDTPLLAKAAYSINGLTLSGVLAR
ncbi:hypothetical protein SAY86_014237 [Trapa natans]|uniref:non-specific serine/threonine protein kinase n=1 Tax=Trapa natans TaxID=22666 RepID=A0AAN7L0T2_TRANT|nr:hypothetical protein SAY86_014237 [Trapa natans]